MKITYYSRLAIVLVLLSFSVSALGSGVQVLKIIVPGPQGPKGADGTGGSGSGSVVPTGTIVANHVAVFNNTTGNVIKDGGALASSATIDTTNPANITQSASYRFATDTEKATWGAKQSALVAGTDYATPASASNASNLTSGTVAAARGGAGAISGIMKANGSGTVSAAVAGTDYLSPTGSAAGLTNFPILNQDTTGTSAGLYGQYTDWALTSGGASIKNKPTTLAGYGITDAATSTQGGKADSALQPGATLAAVYYPAEYTTACTTSLAAPITAANGARQVITLTAGSACALSGASFTQPSGKTAVIGIKVVQASTPTGTITSTGIKWPAATVPTITATASAVDFISCYLDGTNVYCVAAQDFR